MLLQRLWAVAQQILLLDFCRHVVRYKVFPERGARSDGICHCPCDVHVQEQIPASSHQSLLNTETPAGKQLTGLNTATSHSDYVKSVIYE